jgi:predicted neuraminidase
MSPNHKTAVAAALITLLHVGVASAADPQPGVVSSEFIYESAPFPSCHASTIEQTAGGGIVAAWFGGTDEGEPDVGIWSSRIVDGKWTAPVEVVNGEEPDGKRYPTWNPVLFQPSEGELLLVYHVGPNPSTWWANVMKSADGGKTWTKATRLPGKFLGPIKNKPVQVGNRILCPSSTEDPDTDKWNVHMEWTDLAASDWTMAGAIGGQEQLDAIQPTVLVHDDDNIQILCRAKQGKVVESWSSDGGETWSPLAETTMPNNNSGIDAVQLADGRGLMVYNHVGMKRNRWGGRRSPLNVAVTADGKNWEAALVLEDEQGEYSYPAVIQADDGLVHITYTWKRERVKHVVVDPAKLVTRPIVDGQWPK